MFKLRDVKTNKELPKLLSVVVDQAFMSVTTLLTAIVLARTYSKDGYAELVLLFSITLFVLGFQSAIISKPYAISQNDFGADEQDAYFNFNLNLKFAFTLGTVLILSLLSLLFFTKMDPISICYFLLYIVAHSSYFFVRETLLSERKTFKNMLFGLVCSLSLITLLLIIYFKEIIEVHFFLGSASIIYLAITVVFLLQNKKQIRFIKKNYTNYWNTNWKIGKWLIGSNFLYNLSTNVYPWLLLVLTKKEDIAVFGVLMSVAGLVNPLLTALSSYLLPLFVQMNKNIQKLHQNVLQWILLFSVVAVFLILIGSFCGQWIIQMLYGQQYSSLGILVVYPFIVQAVIVIFQPFKIALNALRRTDVNFWILIPRSIIAVTFGYYLVKHYGLAGVFYTMIIENILYQILNYFAYFRIVRLSNSTSS